MMEVERMTFNVVIPVLDEERALRAGVEGAIRFLDGTAAEGAYTITVADNGSTDGTERIAGELCAEYGQVSYLKLGERGVGLAFREAIKHNRSDIVGYMDVDLATDIRHLEQVYRLFTEEGAGVVVGSRLLPGSRVYGRPLLREITSRGLNILLKVLLRVRFSDAMCGFKFYKKDVAEHLVQVGSDEKGWFFCAEMMIRAEWEGIQVMEIPVVWHDDPDSKVKVGKLSAAYLRSILRLCREKRRKGC